MLRCCSGLVLCLMLASYVNAEPPPLSEDQRASITQLANETKKAADRLKGLLDRRQEELGDVYAKYTLDEAKATKLEAEIIDLQKQMLANHRKMQVELRILVGEERFVILRKRLDNMLKTPKPQ